MFKIQSLTPEIRENRRVLRRKIVGIPGRIWRKTRRGLLWTLAIAFVLHSALNIYASMLLNRELSAIRQKGEPLQLSEMAPPAVPDSQNAALIYAQAAKSLRFSRPEKIAFYTREENRSPQEQRLVEAALVNNRKALDLTRRAALMPRCRFPLNYSAENPIGLQFPYYSEVRELTHLLANQAAVETQNGEPDAALRDVSLIFKMAHHLSNEPSFIGFMVAQSLDIEANQALARVLESANLSAAQTRAFENSLPATDWSRAVRRAMMGERIWNIFVFEKLRHPFGGTIEADISGANTPFWVYRPVRLLWLPLLKLDEVQLLRLWKPVLAEPVYQQIPSSPGWPEARLKQYRNKPIYAMLTNILFPTFAYSNTYLDLTEVRKRGRKIALALSTYRAGHGHYPADLNELAAASKQALPLDPYSQRLFVYRRERAGFVLYSVGENRKDNGGRGRGLSLNFGLNNDDVSWAVSQKSVIWLAPPRQ